MNDSPEPPVRIHEEAPPANWREAAAELVSARLELIELEAKQAAGTVARKGIAGGVMAGALFFTWALVLAGGIPLLSMVSQAPWPWVALVMAGIHLLVALACLMKLKKPAGPMFPHTRSEFQRDREWFKNI